MNFDLSTVLAHGEVFGLFICTIVGLLGVFAHWFKKWYKDEITGSLWAYLFHDHIKQTVASVMGFNTAFYGAWFTGAFDGFTTRALLVAAFTAGYMFDSAFNKGKPIEGTAP